MAKELSFKEQIKHPKWQKKRLEIFERDGFKCKNCSYYNDEPENENQLHVHHLIYKKNYLYWEYENKYLVTLCGDCHSLWHTNNDFIKEFLCVLPEKQTSIYALLDSTKEMTDWELLKLSEIAGVILNLR